MPGPWGRGAKPPPPPPSQRPAEMLHKNGLVMEAAESTSPADIKIGRVEKWNEKKNFGFVRPDAGGGSVCIGADHRNPGLRTKCVNLGDSRFAVGNYEGDKVTYVLQRYRQESRLRCRGVQVTNHDRDELPLELKSGPIYTED